MFPAPDCVLAGKYRLLRQLGQGGMGSVWLAEHLTLRSPVAIKLIEPSIASNPEALARFLREAQAAASLRSPHVVQILDHGVDGGVPFIAMEVLEGESLANRLLRVGRIAPPEIAKLMTHVARAMSRAHEAGIVHRDLKPDNIYIVHNDEEELAKVLDFGVAKSSVHGLGLGVSSGTRTGAMLGTPYYMSPEQAEGRAVDSRSDIWAMGVIVWECLLGTRPFEAESLATLLLGICAHPLPVPSHFGPVPHGFDAWFARTCARNPAERYQNVKDLAADLRRICGDSLAATPLGISAAAAHPAPVRSGPLLAGTTGNLGVSAPAAGIPKTKLSGVAVAAALLGLVVVGIGGTLLALRGRSAPAVAASAATIESPSPTSAGAPSASAAALAPLVEREPAVASPTTPPSAVPSGGKSARPAPPAAAAVVPLSAGKAKPPVAPQAPAQAPLPASAAPAAPPAPAPAAKPAVNLGI